MGLTVPSDNKRVKVSFKCPGCETLLKIELLYIPTSRGKEHPKTILSESCNRCYARNEIDYRVYKQRGGEAKLKIFELKSNQKECVRRFKVEQWC